MKKPPIKKIGRYAAILFATLFALFLLVSVAIRIYLTDERLRRLLLPRLREATGRNVEMAGIQAGLFRGITIEDFVVKEEDGVTDFFRAGEFVLVFELMPLLRGRLIISETLLRDSFLRIARDLRGRFNFASLPMLTGKPETETTAEDGILLLPLALTIHQANIDRARLLIEDQQQKLPAVDALVNAAISLDTDPNQERLVYLGRFDFSAEVALGQVKPRVEGQGRFDSQTISYHAKSTVNNSELGLSGAVDNWREAPAIRLDLTSKQLNLDHLFDLAARASAGGEPGAGSETSPSGATVSGLVSVDRAVYRGLEMRDLQTSYLLKQGILQVDDLDMRTAGGKLVGSGRIDLRGTDPEFSGVLEVSSLQASELASLLSERLGDRLAGDLNGSIRFSGSGTNWPRIRKGLSIYAEYDILQGQIREVPVTAAIAELLQLSELRSFSFAQFAGNLRVEQGQVLLKSNLTGPDLRAETLGTISLEGLMNLPVTLHLSGRLAERIRTVTHLTRYLIAAEEGFRVDLRLTGPVTDPRSELDLGAAGKRLREGLEERFKQQVERFLKEAPAPENAPEQPEIESPPARDLLDKLFSR